MLVIHEVMDHAWHTTLDRHDLAVHSFGHGVGDPVCAIADQIGME